MISSAPTKGDMGFFGQKKGRKPPKVTTKKGNVNAGNKGVCTINKEYFGISVQIQKWVPQCNMVGLGRAQFAWRTGGGWGPHGWVSV
jgi:hypothetical protein